MPHQCIHCGKIYPAGSKEVLSGCEECKGKFFFYIKEEQIKKTKEEPIKIPEKERKKVEQEIREIAGIEESDTPVILDIESVRTAGSGKFEIDVVNLFKKNNPIVYKLEEGKYVIDLASKK